MREKSSFRKQRERKAALVAGIVVFACLALVACGSPKAASTASSANAGDDFNKMKAAVATADSSAKAVVYSDEWAAIYPDQYNSLQLNANDSETVSYLEEDPYLAAIYAGTPFSKDYDKARGHSYTITDVQATERISEKSKATCYACKGSYYPSNEDQGTALYKLAFSDATAQATASGQLVSIGCYDCHLNNPGTALSSRDFFNVAFPTAAKEWGSSAAACGQCHNEYYFDSTTGAVALPPGITDPTDMLNYYNSINFVD
jgi:nitrite reductase (cytochrome c-552)